MITKGNGTKSHRSPVVAAQVKAQTGIAGLDEITGGGLPCGRTTLLVGGPGSGKTILALQFLVEGARNCKEPGIFVAFEETSKRISANAEGFGWKLGDLCRKKKLFFLDAQPMPDLIQMGNFDLGGMLAALDAQIKMMGARRIVFDALDIVLDLLPEMGTKRREIYKLHEWLLAREMTAVITSKASGDESASVTQDSFGFMQFMVDCAVVLNHDVVMGVSQRNLRVQKYRGTGFDENQSPFIIGKNGMEVGVARTRGRVDAKVTDERVSSGVERLDTMLSGGYYRGACVLITGFPGTAKTTLSGAFAEAACKRGEPTMFISFDSDGSEVIRNLGSVGIRLDRYAKSGVLRMVSARTISGSAESFLVHIKGLAKEQSARCVVIDPVSALSQSGNELTAHSVAERLFEWSKSDGTTLVCTSLLEEVSRESESGTSLQISKIADTWIHLNYLMQAGERNRGISIIKSRGTSHSNQMRELILSSAGVTLTDAYTAGGEVLMGSMRWQRESADRAEREIQIVARNLRGVKLAAEEAELEVRMKSLQVELAAKQVEKELLIRTSQNVEGELSHDRTRMRQLRGSDAMKEVQS